MTFMNWSGQISRGEWKPELHFTDDLRSPHTPAVKALLARYGPHVQYWYASEPYQNCYSIQLQYSRRDKEIMMQLRGDYMPIPTGGEGNDEEDE